MSEEKKKDRKKDRRKKPQGKNIIYFMNAFSKTTVKKHLLSLQDFVTILTVKVYPSLPL